MKHFDHANPYTSTRIPVFARNVVSTSHPLAAQAGLRILHQGGNAVDAAVAAAAAMTLVEPVSNGLGGDAFCILWDGRQLHGLNSSGPAPAAWTPEYFRRKYGNDAQHPPLRGIDAVTVPGAVGAWAALSERLASSERTVAASSSCSSVRAKVIAPPPDARRGGRGGGRGCPMR